MMDIFRQRSFYNASYVRPKFYLRKTCKVGIFNRVMDIFRQRSFYNASYVRPKFYLQKTCKVGILNRVIDIFGHLSFCNASYVCCLYAARHAEKQSIYCTLSRWFRPMCLRRCILESSPEVPLPICLWRKGLPGRPDDEELPPPE